ncbi:MAG: DNA polymerase I [Calditrichaeota bacterium]|nr:DNA polymerase I [Calditrichota bacterium]
MAKNQKRVFLIDGMALAYRAFFAFFKKPLTNSKGENVSAVYGFTTVMLNILDNEKPDYFAVVFDTPEPTFRHKLFKEYKAQRAEMPEEMIDSLPRIRQMLKILNIPVLEKPGFEADDVMGTLAKRAEAEGLQTVLVTGDKDLMQLVSPQTLFFNPQKKGGKTEWLDEKSVREKIGIPPEKIVDYLALMGDSSDNIPGVPNIGPVTAAKLLNEYGSLESVLQNADKIANKRIRKSLQENVELAHLSKELATIHCDIPLDLEPSELVIGEADTDAAVAFFQEMEFRGLRDRFARGQSLIKAEYHLVNSADKFCELVENLNKLDRFVFDSETTSVDPMRARLVGLSFSWQDGVAYYVPVKGPVDLTSETEVLDLHLVLEQLRPVFENERIKKCAHNAKYDMLVLKQHGVPVRGLELDTMVASYLINPSLRQHNLDSLSLSYLNFKKIPTSTLIGKGKNEITMDQVPVEKVSQYACEDADITWRLRNALEPKLREGNLEKLLQEVEIPLIDVLLQMEQNGVKLDEMFLAKMSRELEGELFRLEGEIYNLAGQKFNINSPKQLSVILFENLKLPVVRKTKTGYSTDVTVLEELAKQHDLPQKILDYRQLAKLKSTYVDALPRLVNPKTGRLHTSYNQTVTATGRLSSSDPNLQNIPIRTEIGRRIRRAFIPTNEDYIIVDADYSQIELRIMAHLSKDETLMASFLHNEDVHRRTAALVFNVAPEQVTADQRRKAKEVNFGIMYGMGAYGLAQRLGISAEEADAFIKAYFVSYPGVQKFMLDIVEKAREDGYVTTLLKRRRYIPEISSDNRRIRDFAERTAINTPIQGSAADMIKVAMINIHRRIQKESLQAKMILQVHDELVFDVPKEELDSIKQIVQSEMENAMKLDVPVKVEVGAAGNWLDAH